MNHVSPGHIRPGSASALALAFLFLFALFAFAPSGARADRGSIGPPSLGLIWKTVPHNACAERPTHLRFSLCSCQVQIESATRDSLSPIVVRLNVDPDVVCVRCVPDSAEVDLGLLRAGSYSYNVRIDIHYTSPPDTSWPASPIHDVVQFGVANTCTEDVPYLDHVIIGDRPCAGCAPVVCPNDSFTVALEGVFPDGCTRLRGITLLPPLVDPVPGSFPVPPTVVLNYE